jgi:hydroxyacylglutathione hydrolase
VLFRSPSSLADERNTNVFLRCHEAAVKDAAEIHSRKVLETPAAVFAVLREWKSQL